MNFAGVVEIDRSQLLTLTNSLRKILVAADASNDIFTESDRLEPKVGQYDLQPLLALLQAEIPTELTLPILKDKAVRLSIPSTLIQQWKTVSSYK